MKNSSYIGLVMSALSLLSFGKSYGFDSHYLPPLFKKQVVSVRQFSEAARKLEEKYSDGFFFDYGASSGGDEKDLDWGALAEGFRTFPDHADQNSVKETIDLAAYTAVSGEPIGKINRCRRMIIQGMYLQSISPEIAEAERKALSEEIYRQILEMEEHSPQFVESDPFLSRVYTYCDTEMRLEKEKESREKAEEQNGLIRLLGEKAPSLSVRRWINSGPLTLEELQGKVVLLDFWGTWCPPCLAKMPEIQRYWDNYKDRDFVAIGIHSATKHDERVRQYVDSAKTNFPIAIDKGERAWNGQTWSKYGIKAVPQTVLIDRDGLVRFGSSVEELLFEGEEPPELSGRWVNSEPASLRDYRGRVITLDFFNLGERESRQFMIEREKNWRQYTNNGLLVIAVHNSIVGYDCLKGFIEQNDITYPNVIDEEVEIGGSKTWERYGIDGTPKTWVIGRDGKIVVGATGQKLMMELQKEQSDLK